MVNRVLWDFKELLDLPDLLELATRVFKVSWDQVATRGSLDFKESKGSGASKE
jgi:hypothetical protein